METKNNKSETYYLAWMNPRDKKLRDAGVAFYNSEYGEYLLKVDEDQGKQYYLKPVNSLDGKTCFRMEMVLKRSNGTFLKRQSIGDGYSSIITNGNVHINYGSKYATLVLFLK